MEAIPSVVVVSDKTDAHRFCSGCVVAKRRHEQSTLVITSYAFTEGHEGSLQVHFSDGLSLDAHVLASRDCFSLLRTEYHEGCVPIRFSGLAPSTSYTLIPKNATSNVRKNTYVCLETVVSYSHVNENALVDESDDYFLVICDDELYKTAEAFNRLVSAPVFSTSGRAIGLVARDCREGGPGALFKVTANARCMRNVIASLIGMIKEM